MDIYKLQINVKYIYFLELNIILKIFDIDNKGYIDLNDFVNEI